MGIENLSELLYACHENRLLLFKGFGKRTQDNVMESIEFYNQQQGNYLFAQVESLGGELVGFLQKVFSNSKIELTGAFKRHAETIGILEFAITASAKKIISKLGRLEEFVLLEHEDDYLLYRYGGKIRVKIFVTGEKSLNEKLFYTIGSEKFSESFRKQFPNVTFRKSLGDDHIFKDLNIQLIPYFLRENREIITLAKKFSIPDVIQMADIKGLIHCHSNWSDGSNTLQQLAEAAIDRGLQYLVISDHSKTAGYARGLSEEKIREQHDLIDELNEEYKPFKIFKSIESDILNDGDLDYNNNFLSTFDLVIASVHSNLNMSEERATARLLRAIENPYTTILGHMTGRLLLRRKGYPVDHKTIIDACVKNNVVIEIYASPNRLDIDWRWKTQIQHRIHEAAGLKIRG